MSLSKAEKNFIVYKSSAGSGKTYTLIKDYLCLILEDSNPYRFQEVLAVTFTNKAANEMKERLIDFLKELAEMDLSEGTNLATQVASDLNISLKDLKFRASNTLNAVLHNYAQLSISTIDKFVHKIIRSFAKDIGLDADFEVEMDTAAIKEQSIDLLLSKINEKEKELSKWTLSYIHSQLDNDSSWDIGSLLSGLYKSLDKEHLLEDLKLYENVSTKEIARYKTEIENYGKEFEGKLLDISTSFFELCDREKLEKSYFYNRAALFNTFKKIQDRKFLENPITSNARKSVVEEKWTATKVSDDVIQKFELNSSILTSLFNQLDAIIEVEFEDYQIKKQFLNHIYGLGLINEVQSILKSIKEENSILLISEFNTIIENIVKDDPVPYIYEKIGERFKNFLIDEFQDTSRKQWRNFLPLVDNSLAVGNTNMIVGDAKQAIYRWRGGDVEQFVDLESFPGQETNQVLREQINTISNNLLEKELGDNWRSAGEIVAFNNQLFDQITNYLTLPEDLKDIYKGAKQHIQKTDKLGYVQLKVVDTSIDKSKAIEEEKKEVLETIKSCLKDGFNYSDIAILVRTNRLGAEYANLLSVEGIPVTSSDSLLLSNSKHIYFILHLLQWLGNKEEASLQVAILEYFYEGENTLIYWEKYKSNFNQFFIDENYDLSLLVDHGGPYALVESVIQIFKLNKEPDSYLQFLLDFALEFETKEGQNNYKFISELEHKVEKISVVVPDNQNAVKVLSIHKSKGLQYPIVLMPGLKSINSGNLSKTFHWVKKEGDEFPYLITNNSKLKNNKYVRDWIGREDGLSLLDHLNVLYVGFTRPEIRLYTWFERGKKNDDKLLPAIQNVFPELTTGDFVFTKGQCVKATSITGVAEMNNENWLVVNSWQEEIEYSFSAPQSWSVEEQHDEREIGTIIHKLLSEYSDVNLAVSSLSMMRNQGVISSSLFNRIKIQLDHVFNDKQLVQWLKAPNQKSEKHILDKDGHQYVPDKVVINETGTIVIDFKTGKIDEKHREQVANYVSLLKEMGYKGLKGYLYYTDQQKTIEV